MADAFLTKLARVLGRATGIAIVIYLAGWWIPQRERNDTDPPDRYSGLFLRTDHLTGCQYVGGILNITPRLDRDGKQICIARGR